MIFIPASEIKKPYEVLGHFYTLQLSSGLAADCRSVLEIRHASSLQQYPDAVFIMMNPGSSQPLVHRTQVETPESISKMSQTLVPTKPDTTQYQVMRVMAHRGLTFVRVLNLSDLREAKSPLFVKKFTDLSQDRGGHLHSVFSPERSAELDGYLKKESDRPIVCAWGLSPDLSPLIAQCVGRIGNTERLIGLLKEEGTHRYRHPLPTLQADKEKWFRDFSILFFG
jgi:hypothetical protein